MNNKLKHQKPQKSSFKSYVNDNNNNNNNSLIVNYGENIINNNDDNLNVDNKFRKLRTFLLTINSKKDKENNCDDKKMLKKVTTSEYNEIFTQKHPILIQNFFSMYQSGSKDSDIGFMQEFLLLEHCSQLNLYHKIPLVNLNDYCDIGMRNRFQNIIPYEHSLVKLSNDKYGYINANFIDGYHHKNEYIATLAPWNNDSIVNFYRLILKFNVRIIVNLVEFESIAYIPKWINEEPKRFKIVDSDQNELTVNVRLIDEEKYDYYVIRHLQIIYDGNNKSNIHDFYQFHFVGWKDFDVPDKELPLLLFIQSVRKCHYRLCSDKQIPTIVHCRAGIGRTGTYIAIDQLWQQLTETFLLPELSRKKLWQQSLEWNESKYLHQQQLQQQKIKHKTSFHCDNNNDNRNKMPTRSSKMITNILRSTTETLIGRKFCRKMMINDIDPIKTEPELFDLLSKSPYTIDIYSIVYRMRSNRRGMVQTDTQYAYIYRCAYFILKNWFCLQLDDDDDVIIDNLRQ